jgi:hypothetical protein
MQVGLDLDVSSACNLLDLGQLPYLIQREKN